MCIFVCFVRYLTFWHLIQQKHLIWSHTVLRWFWPDEPYWTEGWVSPASHQHSSMRSPWRSYEHSSHWRSCWACSGRGSSTRSTRRGSAWGNPYQARMYRIYTHENGMYLVTYLNWARKFFLVRRSMWRMIWVIAFLNSLYTIVIWSMSSVALLITRLAIEALVGNVIGVVTQLADWVMSGAKFLCRAPNPYTGCAIIKYLLPDDEDLEPLTVGSNHRTHVSHDTGVDTTTETLIWR